MALYELTPRALVEGLRRRLKKSLGQNFLIDENITRAIAREVSMIGPDHILEIGPGAGALTIALCALNKPITVIEKDDRCAEYVHGLFSAAVDDFTVIHGDALDAPLPEFCFNRDNRAVLVSNLPYNVASQIYFRFIDADLPLIGMVLMFQREVAQRFTATPGSKHYGVLSVLGQYYHHIETVMDVPPTCFLPAPKVTSTVLRFDPRKRELPKEKEQAFRDFIHAAFAMRRKTLVNSLANFANLDKTSWANLLSRLGFDASTRAESLSLNDFLKIFNAIPSNVD